jgi:cyclic pyranopterin phosphate synthase
MSMVDITTKPEIFREAVAVGKLKLRAETVERIKKGTIAKGDPIYTAKIAGILAAKNTPTIIPLCHPLPLTNVKVEIEVIDEITIKVTSTVRTRAQTGVEMEALVATSVALLTIWDMVKQYEKNATGQYPFTAIETIQVIRKVKSED